MILEALSAPVIEATETATETETNAAPAPALRHVAELVAETARRIPDQTALIASDRTLSYGELDRLIDERARAFAQAGIVPGDRIGICLPRRADAVIAIHACVRLGAVYVPLDPAAPPARRDTITVDAGLRAVIDGSDIPELRDAAAIPAVPVEDPMEALAYIIYTSGSTGRPKGVAIRHRSLAHLVRAMRRSPGWFDGDVVLATAAFTFDVSVPDLFLTLAVGATMVLASEEEAIDGRALLALVRRHRVTLMQSTPSRFRLMLEAGWQPSADRPTLLCGGEAISPALACELSKRGTLWNMYGPTETTVWSTARPLGAGGDDVALGGPIGDTVLRVVDGAGAPVAPGGLGELLIGGPGVAAFYVGRSDLTAERFVADADGAVFYRTGDVVRVRADGLLDYAGRNDHQIKIRGVRIEPGEIEAVLGAHPAIANVLALGRADDNRDPILVAYCVPPAGVAAPDPVALERFAAETLPPLLRPRVVVLDAFPLNSSGKIDRARLPAPPPRVADAAAAPLATDTEHALAAIWAEALGAPVGARDDDFLALGGDSLAATVVDTLIERRFGFHLGVAQLVRTTVLADLAAELDRRLAASVHDTDTGDVQIVSWNTDSGGMPIVALHNLVPFLPLAVALRERHPLHAVALSRGSALARADRGRVGDIAAVYAAVIAEKLHAPAIVLIGWCSAAAVAHEVVRDLQARGVAVARLILIDPEPVGRTAGALRSVRRQVRRFIAGAPRAPRDAARSPSVEGGGFDWLERALARHRPAPVAVDTAIVLPSRAGRFARLWRERAWRRIAGADSRVLVAPGDHATVLAGDGARAVAALIAEP